MQGIHNSCEKVEMSPNVVSEYNKLLLWYNGHNEGVKGRCVCMGPDNGNNTCEMCVCV